MSLYRMTFCSHCNRNVSRTTELLHRKHGVRPRLTADAVAAFRKSTTTSAPKKPGLRQPFPLQSEEDVMMHDEALSSVQHVDDDNGLGRHVLDTRHALFDATIRSAEARTWPHGTQRYAAQVDDYESDDEDEVGKEDDGGSKIDDWSFDDDGFDVLEYTNGLSPWDELGVDFEREAVENGMSFSCSL